MPVLMGEIVPSAEMDRTLASATAQVVAASVPETLRRMDSLGLIVQSKVPFASLESVVPTLVLMLSAEASTVGVTGAVVPGSVVSPPVTSPTFGSSPILGSASPSASVSPSTGLLLSSSTPGNGSASSGLIFATIFSPKSDQLKSSSTTTSTAAIAPRAEWVCFLSETRRPPFCLPELCLPELCLPELCLTLRGWSPSSQNGHLR